MRTSILWAAAFLSGCAGTTDRPIAAADGAGNPDEKADGIRYYESAPFLLVYSDGKGGLQSQILFLPDLARKRSIDPYAYLASNNSTLVFQNGMLTQAKSIVDETIVPKAVIGALEKVATGLLAGALNDAGAQPPTQLPPPQLFRILFTKTGAKLVGGPGTGPDGQPRMIDVTISEPDKPDAAAKPAAAAAKKENDQ
jgi:hypothetical protein